MSRLKQHSGRLLSLLLAAAVLLSPGGRGFAVEEDAGTIELIEISYPGPDGEKIYYTSPNRLGRVYIRNIFVEIDGAPVQAFCLQSRGSGALQAGMRFSQPESASLPYEAARFLDYYYYQLEEHARLHREHPSIACTPGDEALKQLPPGLWGPDKQEWAGTCIQTVLWLWERGAYAVGGSAAQREVLADEWSAVLTRLYGDASRAEVLDLIGRILAATDREAGWIPCRTYQVYREKGGTLKLIVPAAEPDCLELPAIGATGYALIDLPLYKDFNSSESELDLPAGTPFLVEEEAGRRWRVSGSFGEGWVAHTCCMINLPDVVPSIVYDITNGYGSIFRSAGHGLEGVTGEALYTGKTRNNRLGRDEFMVPVLYAAAKKIAAAQAAALEAGDTLILYEGYRPASAQERVRSSFHSLVETCPDVALAVNSGPWGESWFIAQGISNHQRGYAIDVSLGRVTKSRQEALAGRAYRRVLAYEAYHMPSAVHELSVEAAAFLYPVSGNSPRDWRKAPASPGFTPDARRLQAYCTAAGLTPLASEWWHFNDLDACAAAGGAGEGLFEIEACLSVLPPRA